MSSNLIARSKKSLIYQHLNAAREGGVLLPLPGPMDAGSTLEAAGGSFSSANFVSTSKGAIRSRLALFSLGGAATSPPIEVQGCKRDAYAWDMTAAER